MTLVQSGQEALPPSVQAEEVAGHTPGPWAVHPHSARVVPADHVSRPIGGASDAAVDKATYAQVICALFWPDRNRSEDEVKANARLIAAAPDLLAFADMVARVYSDHSPASEEGILARNARAAILRATGAKP